MDKFGPVMLLIGVIFLLLYFFTLIFLNTRKKDKDETNSFLNSFPYQFYSSNNIQMRIFLYVMLLVSTLLISFGYASYFSSLKSVHFIVLAVLFPVSLLFVVISNLIPLSNYKPHIFFALFGFATFIFACFFYAFSNLIPGAVMFQNSISIFSTVVLGIFGGLGFVSLFNRKLFDWPKMNKTEVDGKTIYLKPKVNYLALYEWVFLILEGLSAIVIFINCML